MTETNDGERSGNYLQALWYVEPGRCDLQLEPLDDPAPDWVQVRTLATAISRGTEGLVFAGKVPESEWGRMRAPHQEGDFPFPVKYGYACAGVVTAGHPDHIGRKVFGLFPHQTCFNAPIDELVFLQDAMPVERAVLAANMETALNALWDGSPSPGDHICVVGGGVVGLLTAYLAARIPGTEVTVVDIEEGRRSIAELIGCRFSQPEQAPADQDLVFHCSASEAGLSTALKTAGHGASIIEMSWYGDRKIGVPLGADFHSRRLVLKSSQVGTIPADRQARWSYRRRLSLALSLLDDPVLDKLISHRIPFAESPKHLPDILGGKVDALAPVLVYS